MTAEEALAEEQRLVAEHRQAHVRIGELGAEVKRLKTENASLDAENVSLLKASARGQDVGARLAEVRAEQKEIEEAIAQNEQAREAAHAASQDAEMEVAELRSRELQVLALDADAYTVAAQKALAEAEGPYLAAQQAWADAEARWGRLGSALQGRLRETQEEAGVYAAPGNVNVAAPGFPLPDGQMAFQRSRSGSLLARPEAVAHIEAAGERKERTT